MNRNYAELVKLLPEPKQEGARDLITELNFLNETLRKLRAEIRKSGVIVEWHNGSTEKGQKESPALKSYNATLSKKTSIIRLLNVMLGDNAPEMEDELNSFLDETPTLKVV